jgi:hypothetical protein
MMTTAELQISDVRRLVLVGSCVAAAAAANYAGPALPERGPVALGAAALGVLLMLRRRPQPELAEGDAEAQATTAASQPARGGRGVRPELEALGAALGAALASVERHLGAHEQRLTSLSGRQSLLQVEAREMLADFGAKLKEIEMRLMETEEQTQQIRAHHLDLLRRLNASLVDAVGASSGDASP